MSYKVVELHSILKPIHSYTDSLKPYLERQFSSKEEINPSFMQEKLLGKRPLFVLRGCKAETQL